MASIFSNLFPRDPAASLSYRDLGGLVKATYFEVQNIGSNVISTTNRVWLTVLPANARIVGGFLMVTESFGPDITGTLRRETGNVALFGSSARFSLSNPSSSFIFDRRVRAVRAVMPNKPVNPKGERIGLALSRASNPGAGKLHGLILYV